MSCFGAPDIRAARGETRTLALYNIHTKETSTVLFKKDGQYIKAGLEKLNWALRDWRRDEATTMDPKLLDLLWEVHTELGSKEPIHVISAYRSRNTNNMLRSSVGGQASESRHITGEAIDVHFPDIPVKQIRYSALIRERGGVGYYPTSAIPFVHLDTARVRAWPRLPRHELALLFPSGKSQHLAEDGGSISADDVKQAKARHRSLATEMAAYHELRTTPRPSAVAVAAVAPKAEPQPKAQQVAAAPSLPPLKDPPRVVDRPSQLATGPSPTERARLNDAIALAAAPPVAPSAAPAITPPNAPRETTPKLIGEPQLATKGGLGRLSAAGLSHLKLAGPIPQGIAALENVEIANFDEDHADELAYRPFPIAPFLTTSASIDDPVFATLHHPDAQRTLDLLDAAGAMPPMRLRPTERVAALMLAQSFKGEAVNIQKAFADPDAPATDQLPQRPVSTR
jgi:uncharacterized protein YcbK (DUF882 family)